LGYKHYSTCRICGNRNLLSFLDLKNQPPANALLSSPEQKENFYPLKVYYCQDCGLIQLTDVVDPEELFTGYSYFTGFSSQTMKNHFHTLAQALEKEMKLTSNDLVVDIGGNDGTLLEAYEAPNKINIEPSAEQAALSKGKGITTYTNFFNTETARSVVDMHGKAKIITAANVFAHLDNLFDFMAGIRRLLQPNGVFIIEVHHALNLIQKLEWDVVYHEHLCYYTLSPLNILGSYFGLSIIKVEEIPTQGGSLRIYFGNVSKGTEGFRQVISKEYEAKLYQPETFLNFGQRVNENNQNMLALLAKLKREGKTIVGYGCPAKASTMTNALDLGKYLEYILDTTPAKQGKYTPGQHIPIVSPDRFHEAYPDYAIMFSWNYKTEILAKEQDFLKKGGKFIIPIPEVQVIEK
jgi:hypothetical protein